MYLLLPSISALLYPLAAFLLKRSMQEGIGPWRATFITNIVIMLLYQPLRFFAGDQGGDPLWWQPALAALSFICGQTFTFLALQRGDVSAATPMLGVKVVLVAFFSVWLTDDRLTWNIWTGAVLSTFALALLGVDRPQNRQKILITAVWASLSAACFAITDVQVQLFAPAWGALHFIPAMFFCVGLLSFAFVPFFSRGIWSAPAGVWPWVLAGAVLTGVQALGMALSLSIWGHAAEVNVMYSARGLWSIALAYVVGSAVGSHEQEMERQVLLARIGGATLMTGAIAVVLFL